MATIGRGPRRLAAAALLAADHRRATRLERRGGPAPEGRSRPVGPATPNRPERPERPERPAHLGGRLARHRHPDATEPSTAAPKAAAKPKPGPAAPEAKAPAPKPAKVSATQAKAPAPKPTAAPKPAATQAKAATPSPKPAKAEATPKPAKPALPPLELPAPSRAARSMTPERVRRVRAAEQRRHLHDAIPDRKAEPGERIADDDAWNRWASTPLPPDPDASLERLDDHRTTDSFSIQALQQRLSSRRRPEGRRPERRRPERRRQPGRKGDSNGKSRPKAEAAASSAPGGKDDSNRKVRPQAKAADPPAPGRSLRARLSHAIDRVAEREVAISNRIDRAIGTRSRTINPG